jgi:hypothetical protein
MKQLILSLFLISFLTTSYAQVYDLLVTNDNDSLACKIDSITDTHLWFEMRHNYNWIHTYFSKDQIKSHKKDAVDMKYFRFKEGSSEIETRKKFVPEGYQHAHRLMFAPTTYGLKAKDLYFTTYGGMIYSLQFGFTDNISFDIGSSFLAVPWYAMINFSYPVSENFAFTVGNISVFDIWLEPGLWGNMTYGLLSFGKPETQINAGTGYIIIPNTLLIKTNTPAYTLSGQIQIGDRVFLLSEHYYAKFNDYYENAYLLPGSTQDNPIFREYDYVFNRHLIFGITGFRITGNRNPNIAWQLGLAEMIYIFEDNVPEEYRLRENHLDDGKVGVYPFPFISFSYKFGKNYK